MESVAITYLDIPSYRQNVRIVDMTWGISLGGQAFGYVNSGGCSRLPSNCVLRAEATDHRDCHKAVCDDQGFHGQHAYWFRVEYGMRNCAIVAN